jgi:hypothetical protein
MLDTSRERFTDRSKSPRNQAFAEVDVALIGDTVGYGEPQEMPPD